MKKFIFVSALLFCLSLPAWSSTELGGGSASSYPTSMDTDVTKETDDDYARIAVPNDLAAAIIRLEVTLGTAPAGTYGDVQLRLADLIPYNSCAKHISLGTYTLKVNTVTVTGNNFSVGNSTFVVQQGWVMVGTRTVVTTDLRYPSFVVVSNSGETTKRGMSIINDNGQPAMLTLARLSGNLETYFWSSYYLDIFPYNLESKTYRASGLTISSMAYVGIGDYPPGSGAEGVVNAMLSIKTRSDLIQNEWAVNITSNNQVHLAGINCEGSIDGKSATFSSGTIYGALTVTNGINTYRDTQFGSGSFSSITIRGLGWNPIGGWQNQGSFAGLASTGTIFGYGVGATAFQFQNTSGGTDGVILANSASQAGLRFGYVGATYQGRLVYDNTANRLDFYTNGSQGFYMNSLHHVVFLSSITCGTINGNSDTQFGSGSFSSGTITGSQFSVGGSTLVVHEGIMDVPGNTKLSMTMLSDDYVMVSSTVRFNYLNVGCTDYYGEWDSATSVWTCKFSGLYNVSAHLGGVVLPAGVSATMEITGITNGAGSDLENRQVNWDAANPQVFAFHISRLAYIAAGNTLYVKFYSMSDPENSRIYSSTQWSDFTIMRIP